MSFSKKLCVAACLTAVSFLAFAAETKQTVEETSVENEYLNDVDGEIIMSLAESDDYDNKLVALQYLQSALDEGNTSDSVLKGLERLAGEGINSQTRENGRLMNNFPDIRREACLLMAKVPTEHTKNVLVGIAIADAEPMVVAAAVKSLGTIGINENDEVVEAISFANRRNQVLNPTSSLAMEVLEAYEKLADSTENKKTMIDSLARISSDYHYVTPVRQKALKMLKTLSSQSDSSSSKGNEK
jgi:hypothetical protein